MRSEETPNNAFLLQQGNIQVKMIIRVPDQKNSIF